MSFQFYKFSLISLFLAELREEDMHAILYMQHGSGNGFHNFFM